MIQINFEHECIIYMALLIGGAICKQRGRIQLEAVIDGGSR